MSREGPGPGDVARPSEGYVANMERPHGELCKSVRGAEDIESTEGRKGYD